MTPRPYADAAQRYWSAGWANPIPVKGKWPPPTGYTGYDGASVSWPDIQAWLDGDEAGQNIALRLPGDVVGIDVDAHSGKTGEVSLAAAEAELGQLPATHRSTSRAPFDASGIRFYRVPPDANLRGAEKRFRARFGDHVDIIRRDHRYAVVWPSVHPDTGQTYTWYGPDDTEAEIPRPADLPDLPPAWVEFLTAPAAPEQPAEVPADAPATEGRRFTRAEAAEFVQPHLDALRAAPDGTINNRLNDAAKALSHFVPSFWDVAAARALLLDALSATAYDGRTWRAESTIASGLDLKPGDWVAELVDVSDAQRAQEWVESLPEAEEELADDGRGALVRREADKLHLRAEARDLFAAERHAAGWTPPVHHGDLQTELLMPDDGPQWRLRGLLGVGHNAILVAARKTGKTTTVDNLVRAYVDGESFLGRFDVTLTGRAVGIFNYEVDESQYRRWLRESGIVNMDRVFVLHLRGRSLPLKDVQVRAWTENWLRDRDIGLWIVDPYSRAYVGSLDNGNDEAQVGSFLDTLDVIKARAGVDELVMPVHTPKGRMEAGEESAIGSQRLEGWPDSMWYLTRDQETGLRFLRAEGRDVDVPQEQLTYDTTSRRLTFGGWDQATLRKRADADAVITFVGEHPGCTQNDIQRGLEWTNARKVQNAIRVAGNAIRTEPGARGSTKHWTNP